MGTLNEDKQARLHALNDMNKLNIPVYLLRVFNERRKEASVRRKWWM